MTDFFQTLLDRSLSASWLVLAVLVVRFVLKKAPKWMICSLWALVALRLLCPFSLESSLSLVPEMEPVSQEILSTPAAYPLPGELTAAVSTPVPAEDNWETLEKESYFYATIQKPDGTEEIAGPIDAADVEVSWLDVCAILWPLGVLAMCLYAAFSYLHIRRKVAISMELQKGIHICDEIGSPFILGIVKPKIYLPSDMDPADIAHVLAHEQAHLKRKDHWWKPLGYLLLSIHWFNPLLWLSYILLCRDIELACDERVVKKLPSQQRKAYSEALLNCSLPRNQIAACPLAFGEVGVKQRIQSVLSYRKPGFWVLLVSVVVITAVAVCFLTDPLPIELESPFYKYLWATELVYSEDGGSLNDLPSELLDTIYLTQTGSFSINVYRVFEEITLTEINFDAYFSEDGVWYHSSAQRLRKQTANAWVLYGDDYSYFGDFSRDFYYLLQLKDGSLYLTSGSEWLARQRAGKTRIESVCKVEEAHIERPLVDSTTPFQYTRTLDETNLLNKDELRITLFSADGTTTEYEIYDHILLNLLHSIPEDAFTLGAPVETVEASIFLDWLGQSNMDVTLRYGGGKVEMAFHENTPFSYADTGDKAWIIRHEDLIDLFRNYADNFPPSESVYNPQDPWQWCQEIRAEHLSYVQVARFFPQRLNSGYEMEESETQELLSELKRLPSSAFLPSSFDPDNQSLYDASMIHFTPIYPADISVESYYYGEICCYEGKVYFALQNYYGDNSRLAWEIDSESFAAYLNGLIDPDRPRDFGTTEYATGSITVSHGSAGMTLDVYDFLEYEAVEYTDDETPFGIRFRPLGIEEGWIFLAFFPNGFTPDDSWEKTFSGTLNGTIDYQDYQLNQGDTSTWRAHHLTNLAGDYVALNENADAWFEEYYREISYYSSRGNSKVAPGCLTKDKILKIAKHHLGSEISIQVNGEKRFAYSSFDYKTGIWTFATEADETHESVIALRLDAQGNVLP